MSEEKLKNAIKSKPEVKSEISDWQEKHSPLQEELHIKYNPSEKGAKNHLEAILADVNEESKVIEEHLNKEYNLKNLALNNLDFLGDLGDIGVGKVFLSKSEAEAEKKHQEELKRQRETDAYNKNRDF
ncbi:MAG: hypothetical protein SFT90_06960 [Rickettsiales bacterium]|nr:hypothetical protein [Rickettsiales bacterium]